MKIFRNFLLVSFLFLAPQTIAADRPPHPVVVELFTSEGCSSCPPADQFLEALSHNANIIAIAYHVDYWDDEGWKDTFSLPQSTFRQKQYMKALNTDLFTPQMVVQGQYSASGNQHKQVLDMIKAAEMPTDWIEPQLQLTADGKLNIHIDEHPGRMVIYLVSYQKQASIDVKRGENAGATLNHINSVVDIEAVSQWNGEKFDFTMQKPKGDAATLIIQNLKGNILGAANIELGARP